MLSKKILTVTMVTDEFLENRIILQKSVATIGFIWFLWFHKCILLYIFVQVFLVMRCIRSHIFFFRLELTPTLKEKETFVTKQFSDAKHIGKKKKKTPPTFVIRCKKLNNVCFEGAPLIILARNVKLFFH